MGLDDFEIYGGPDLFLAAEMEKGQTKRPGPDLSGA